MSATLILTASLLTAIYLYFLNRKVQGPPLGPPPLTPKQLDAVTYNDIDLTENIPPVTRKGYAVVGGSGFLGTYLVRLLLLRGETDIRVVDLHPLPSSISSNPAVSYVQTDITSLDSVRNALLQPFHTTGKPPAVIYHMAALIRFWERTPLAWHLSYKVNVLGTRNIVAVAKEISDVVLIYTSTANVVIPSVKFCRLGLDRNAYPWNKHTVSDDDLPLAPWEGHQSCYAVSKLLAERLVIEANGQRGLKTGIIRPGYNIVGPNDRFCSSVLLMDRVPVFGQRWSHTDICAWDAVSAHLLLEDALIRVPEEAAGQAFLVTGKSSAWSMRDIRDTIKYYSSRPLIFDELPDLLILILAHLIELFIFMRDLTSLLFVLLFGGTPRPEPKWLGEAVYLQPATLEFFSNTVIDDSRARKILRYQPQWAMEQVIKYTVDEMQAGRSSGGHGLQLKAL